MAIVQQNYRVTPGDTLPIIAEKYATTVAKLTADNPGLNQTGPLQTGTVVKVIELFASDMFDAGSPASSTPPVSTPPVSSDVGDAAATPVSTARPQTTAVPPSDDPEDGSPASVSITKTTRDAKALYETKRAFEAYSKSRDAAVRAFSGDGRAGLAEIIADGKAVTPQLQTFADDVIAIASRKLGYWSITTTKISATNVEASVAATTDALENAIKTAAQSKGVAPEIATKLSEFVGKMNSAASLNEALTATEEVFHGALAGLSAGMVLSDIQTAIAISKDPNATKVQKTASWLTPVFDALNGLSWAAQGGTMGLETWQVAGISLADPLVGIAALAGSAGSAFFANNNDDPLTLLSKGLQGLSGISP